MLICIGDRIRDSLMMQRYYFLLENMYRAMMIFWLTCLVGYPRTSAPEPEKGFHSVLAWVDRTPRWHCQLVYGDIGHEG